MPALPSATAVTTPPGATVATEGFSDVHVAVLVLSSVAPVDNVTVAVSLTVPPDAVISVGPLTRTDVTVGVPEEVVVGAVTDTVREELSPEQPPVTISAPIARASAPTVPCNIPSRPAMSALRSMFLRRTWATSIVAEEIIERNLERARLLARIFGFVASDPTLMLAAFYWAVDVQ
jgi:hypothetical protein